MFDARSVVDNDRVESLWSKREREREKERERETVRSKSNNSVRTFIIKRQNHASKVRIF